MKTLLKFLIVIGLMLSATFGLAAEPVKVVYHVNEGIPQAVRALGNIRNHLNADPTAKIIVVTHGAGIDFLLEGAQNAQGMKFSSLVGDLVSKGVQFEVCKNTLDARGIPENQVIMEAKIVPSGVAEIAKLQARERFVYLKP